MQKFSSSSVGVCQGSTLVFSAFETNGAMWTGDGDRTASHTVKFAEVFTKPPAVHLSLNMFDVSAQSNARADVAAENITTDSFTIVFRTWGDTKVARVRADWLAIGPVGHPDDFVL